MGDCCEYLLWDSEFFGLQIGRVVDHYLDVEKVEEINQWIANQNIDCLYFLANADDVTTTSLAESNGYHLVDLRVTLEHKINDTDGSINPQSGIRFAALDDLVHLREIASQSHTDARFYSDPLFNRAKVDALYATWIENSYQGFAQAVLVASINDTPAGYITCHLDPESTGRIGLIAVAPEARGQQLGTRLIESALNWFQQQGCQRVTVVTQGRNVQAQRLYQKCGFLTHSIQIWYHRWSKFEGWDSNELRNSF
jgi:dTDP-4-amino-4,6-dideoxy-D-galactose acyltransferase